MKEVPKSQVFQLLSVAAITSSIIVKPKQKVKANNDYCKTYWEKKGDEYKIKDAERKRSDQEKRKYLDPKKYDEIKKKGAAQIQEYRLKKKLAEQFACDSQKETRRMTIHFIIIFFETNSESKYKKGRKISQSAHKKQ